MPFTKLSLILFLICILFSMPAMAEDGAKLPSLPQSEVDFNKKTARLNSLSTRIREDNKHFAEAVQRKSQTADPGQIQLILKDMVQIAKDRNKSVDEYNKLKSDLMYKYPNKGVPLNRTYRTQSKRTMEEMEGAAGLDELLTRVRNKIREKFAPFMPQAKQQVKAPQNADSSPTKEKRLRLEK